MGMGTPTTAVVVVVTTCEGLIGGSTGTAQACDELLDELLELVVLQCATAALDCPVGRRPLEAICCRRTFAAWILQMSNTAKTPAQTGPISHVGKGKGAEGDWLSCPGGAGGNTSSAVGIVSIDMTGTARKRVALCSSVSFSESTAVAASASPGVETAIWKVRSTLASLIVRVTAEVATPTSHATRSRSPSWTSRVKSDTSPAATTAVVIMVVAVGIHHGGGGGGGVGGVGGSIGGAGGNGGDGDAGGTMYSKA